ITVPVTSATAESLYIYDVDATDPDVGDVLTYSLTTAPAGMTIDPTTGLIEWTPTSEQAGDNSVTVSVTDGVASDSQTFSVSVQAASANTVTVAAIEMRSKVAGRNYFAQAFVTVYDQDSNPIAGAVVSGEWDLPDNTTISVTSAGTAGDGQVTVDSPKQSTAGTFTFRVTNVALSGYTYTPGVTQNSVSVP
ncbi:MAG: putative Ig domain-containing protein, partial [Phycisphaerae bacterium]|nr:putative Ig domain-containing protein [Phycisphaerae bacterium]